MTQRLTIAFADAPGAVQGIAIEGAGAVVASADGVRALPGALLREGPDGAWALSAPGALELAFEPVGGDAPSRLLHARGEIGANALDGDALLSTTYDGEGRVVHFGLELWEGEESEFARRAAGEASAHGELAHPDGALTRVAFLACHGDGGRAGPGVYAITTVS